MSLRVVISRRARNDIREIVVSQTYNSAHHRSTVRRVILIDDILLRFQ